MNDRTLVVGPAWVGDMVMAQALFKAIQQRYPQTTLDVLAPEWSRPLTDRMPEVANSVVMPIGHGKLKLTQRYQLAKALRRVGYRRSIVLPNSFKSALIPWWAKIPHRIGWRGECRYGLLNDVRVLKKDDYPRMVDRYVALAYDKGAKASTFSWSPPALVVSAQGANAALKKHALQEGRPILVLCPGAEFGASKRWPEHSYAAVANHYLKQGWQVWVMGSVNDNRSAVIIQCYTQDRVEDLTGRTSLSEAIDLLSLAKGVVTNDSGLMHIACALGRPTVALYGSTDPGYTPPLSMAVSILRAGTACSPCFKRECPLQGQQHHQCMKQLEVNKVVDAMDKLLGTV